MFDFKFVGDFDFKGEDAWLQFRIPLKVLRELVSGSSEQIFIDRGEIVSLLRAIDRNPKTSQSYKEIIRNLLKRA
jgi:hypothetical protein